MLDDSAFNGAMRQLPAQLSMHSIVANKRGIRDIAVFREAKNVHHGQIFVAQMFGLVRIEQRVLLAAGEAGAARIKVVSNSAILNGRPVRRRLGI